MSADETALFSLGSFWEAEDLFMRLPGVVSTEVGYAGGTSSHPTFHDMGDHSESVHITFDPRQVSYEDLLHLFWKSHDPAAETDTQHRSAILYLDIHQRQAAERSKAAMQAHHDHPILTSIEPATKFYKAEDYHQRYIKRLDGEPRSND